MVLEGHAGQFGGVNMQCDQVAIGGCDLQECEHQVPGHSSNLATHRAAGIPAPRSIVDRGIVVFKK
jgi:hypothetical protein